jgi:hypothetical protein
MQRRSITKAAQLVPVSAARWHSIYKYFSRKTIEKMKQEKTKVVRKRHTHLHPKSKPKENLEQSSQNHYKFPFQLIKAGICTMRSRAAKRTENA